MIQVHDVLLLSYAKLRTRKIRLTVTVAISALLFAGLVLIAIVATGAINSLEDFGKEGYGGRYLVQAMPLRLETEPDTQQQTVDQLKPAYDDLVKQKKALAKKLNLTYDETNDQNLPLFAYKNGAQTQYFPNFNSKIAQDFLQKQNADIPGTSFAAFTTAARTAGATNTFHGSNSTGVFGQSYVSALTDGKENLDKFSSTSEINGNQAIKGVQSIATLGWRTLDSELLLPFVLPGQNLATGKDGSIPVVAPMSAAEEVLNIKPLPETATSTQKLERLDYVRKNIAHTTAQLCYRNSISTSLLSQAFQQQKEIDANKNKKDYVQPSLIYTVPTEACAPVTIKSDKRTADEKKQSENQKQFDRQFGLETEQSQGMVRIRIVGITPDINTGASLSATAILTSLFSSSLGSGWISPTNSARSNPIASVIQTGNTEGSSSDSGMYYAEFSNLQSMKKFIEDQTCKDTQVTAIGPSAMVLSHGGTPGSFVTNCIKQKRVLSVSTYGNSAGAIEEFRRAIWKVVRFVILAVVVIAALIMMGNVGKIIADSRRETAVFRALGAGRFDISQVYLGYTILLSLLIAVCAFVLGSIGAYIVHQKFHTDISTTAVITYNASDIHKQFNLFGLDFRLLLGVLGLVIFAGLLSAVIPLLTNMRRNPIRDMRNES